ncbi:MAG TPA: roadblock/LC7 domain-containing protein [Gemmatimonadaceae bacterium]|nr:roadblock/LC7 domain-containing protein [Gemmatimonadaceae bacterium]
MSTQFTPVLTAVMKQRGVTGCLLVDESDGVIIDSTLQFGMRGNVFAALVASLYKKTRQSIGAAGMGEASLLQLDAERGRVFATGREGLVLVAITDLRANSGLVRVELLKARERIA